MYSNHQYPTSTQQTSSQRGVKNPPVTPTIQSTQQQMQTQQTYPNPAQIQRSYPLNNTTTQGYGNTQKQTHAQPTQSYENPPQQSTPNQQPQNYNYSSPSQKQTFPMNTQGYGGHPQQIQPTGQNTQPMQQNQNANKGYSSSVQSSQNYGKQILRIDGNSAFLEVMDSKFNEGKVTINFTTYDKNLPKGQRQKDFIRFNLTFEEFFNLGHEVLFGNLMFRQPIDNYSNLSPAILKGVPSKYNSDNKAIARRLEIKNGDKMPIRLICSEGQGEETNTGLIKMVGQAEKRVQVGMSRESFRSLFLVVQVYIQAYLTNHYAQCVK